eukprot:COSAG02_NODE_6609_length_3462_cov_2.162355_2_plen_91_part_00
MAPFVAVSAIKQRKLPQTDTKPMTNPIGSFYGGHKDALLNFFEDYNYTVTKLLDDGYIDHDQQLFAMIAATWPPYMRFIEGNFYSINALC